MKRLFFAAALSFVIVGFIPSVASAGACDDNGCSPHGLPPTSHTALTTRMPHEQKCSLSNSGSFCGNSGTSSPQQNPEDNNSNQPSSNSDRCAGRINPDLAPRAQSPRKVHPEALQLKDIKKGEMVYLHGVGACHDELEVITFTSAPYKEHGEWMVQMTSSVLDGTIHMPLDAMGVVPSSTGHWSAYVYASHEKCPQSQEFCGSPYSGPEQQLLNDDLGPTPNVAPSEQHCTSHIVVRGDTLWELAASMLGNSFRWRELSSPYLSNPRGLAIGSMVSHCETVYRSQDQGDPGQPE